MRTNTIIGFFLLAFVFAIIGGVMFTGRKIWNWPNAQSSRYLYWERSVWITGMIILTLGTVLFVAELQSMGENILSPLALTAFLIGAVLIIVAECYSLDTQRWLSYTVRLSVIVLFLSQALFGVSMLQTGQFPQWLGWVTIIYNIGLCIILFRAKDPYYPAAHYIMPLVIAVTLIFR